MLTSTRETCWCGIPVWKHIKDAEEIERRHGVSAKDKPKPRRQYRAKPVKDLDRENEDGSSFSV